MASVAKAFLAQSAVTNLHPLGEIALSRPKYLHKVGTSKQTDLQTLDFWALKTAVKQCVENVRETLKYGR